MKYTLKLTSTLLLGATLSFSGLHTYDEEPRDEIHTEQQEVKEVERAEARAAHMEEKIERKKLLIRVRLEARGLSYDEIENYIDRLFPV